MRHILIILFSLTLTGCFDEDGFVIKPIPIEEVKIPYSMYEYQTYFNLSNAEVVAHTNYADWDLGFESSSNGYHIILNSSKFMYAGNTYSSDFNSIQGITSEKMLFDKSDGNLDSTAIGKWADFSTSTPTYSKKVYIINLGVNEDGVKFGFKKIVFEKLENNIYFIHYANLDNTDEHTFQIPKDPTKNFVQFSFNNGGNLNTQQPSKDSWDICFTKYSSILLDDYKVPTPYIVRGVLNNINGIEIARDSLTSFDAISMGDISKYKFVNTQDGIGYDWKVYRNDVYSIVDKISYIIKDRNNLYYKLRFTGYYNSIKNDPNFGAKGYPSFEISKLNNQ